MLAKAIEPISNKNNLVLSYNGGKDSCVIFYLVQALFSKSGNPILEYLQDQGYESELGEINSYRESFKIDQWRYIFFQYNQEEEFSEIIDYMDQIELDYSIVIEKCTNKIKDDLETLVSEHDVSTVILGNRRTDPYSETLLHVQKSSEGWPDFTRIHPILDWSYWDVWKFIKFFNFKVCVLYDQGYTSLGLISNTRKNPYLIKKMGSGDSPNEYYPAWYLHDASKERESRNK